MAEAPLDRLQKLAALHQSRVLTDAEFAEAKGRILTAGSPRSPARPR